VTQRLMTALAVALLLLGAMTTMTTNAFAQRREWGDRDWVELGCQRVSFRVDHDVVPVGRREGRFKAIRVFARGGDVEMLDLKVIYGNGAPDDVPVRSVLRRGDRSRSLDLRGWERSIDRVEMVYRALPSFRGRDAEVCLEGLAGEAPPPAAPVYSARPAERSWEELGCKQVALFRTDRDSIPVGRREGRFKAIRLFVRNADVEMLDLSVIYSYGRPDDVPVRQIIRQGERTRPLELRGWERAIERVDMVYRTVPNYKGLASVCLEGQQ
jgi:hypothetical protein